MPEVEKKREFLSGAEAITAGALAAGLRFFAGYPITPSTEIAEILSRKLPEVGGTFIQMEDEIASISAIIGASIGGTKSMTATSGPGFSLMMEGIGFGCMAEIPCVIVNVQRGGPSTGLPTKVGQGDVMQTRWGTHGDHMLIALCPSTVYECFTLTVRAFNLAEKYRVPVVLLTDETVAHMRESTVLPTAEEYQVVDRELPTVPPEWYLPYERAHGKIAPMASFGSGYRYNITGLTHDSHGFPTMVPSEVDDCVRGQVEKIIFNLEDIVEVEKQYMDDAEIMVVCYGITARAAKEAVAIARSRGIKVGILNLLTIWPFPVQLLHSLAEKMKMAIVPEINMGQIIREVKSAVEGRCKVVGINRVDGDNIYPKQILSKITEVSV